jgi:hypothetical protein
MLNRSTADQVFVNNELKILRGAVAVPNALGINHGNRSAAAYPQTPNLGSKHGANHIYQLAFAQSLFKKIPTGLTCLKWRALTVTHTQKNMTFS